MSKLPKIKDKFKKDILKFDLGSKAKSVVAAAGLSLALISGASANINNTDMGDANFQNDIQIIKNNDLVLNKSNPKEMDKDKYTYHRSHYSHYSHSSHSSHYSHYSSRY